MEYLTVAEVAAELQVSIETVRRLIRSGALRASALSWHRPGRAGYRIRRADLDAFVESRARGGPNADREQAATADARSGPARRRSAPEAAHDRNLRF